MRITDGRNYYRGERFPFFNLSPQKPILLFHRSKLKRLLFTRPIKFLFKGSCLFQLNTAELLYILFYYKSNQYIVPNKQGLVKQWYELGPMTDCQWESQPPNFEIVQIKQPSTLRNPHIFMIKDKEMWSRIDTNRIL